MNGRRCSKVEPRQRKHWLVRRWRKENGVVFIHRNGLSFPFGKSGHENVFENTTIYGNTSLKAGLVNEVTVAALVTALVSRLEGKLDGAEPGHRHVRNKDQSGTTTSGNLVGAAIRPRNLGANLKAKIQEGRNGVTSSNYRKQLLFQLTTRDYARRFRNDLNPCQNPYTDTTIVLQKFRHASRHTHRDFPHPKKAGKDQIRQDTAVMKIILPELNFTSAKIALCASLVSDCVQQMKLSLLSRLVNIRMQINAKRKICIQLRRISPLFPLVGSALCQIITIQ
ncbi:hypothetical protein T4D_5664 [Trichinella pseudospiralis]|uniref:Uncharacterized protein n=1 Tax=Trichinella pseudospiralis TaxID=6337 RepID=A0A0V1FWR4_TRIPS|nr:hypothetical protein T4D_5664 [Trichinella pseudospiralis]